MPVINLNEQPKYTIINKQFSVMKECINDLCEIIDLIASFGNFRTAEDARYIAERAKELKAYVEQQECYFVKSVP